MYRTQLRKLRPRNPIVRTLLSTPKRSTGRHQRPDRRERRDEQKLNHKE